jgi:uncharacterized damage-inducible protein DinB
MDLLSWFRHLARYNRIANQRLYDACGRLSDGEYRKERIVSFGSIHALLNHILLGDRIWMARFEGGGQSTPPLNAILYADFASLREARGLEDDRIESFFQSVREEQLNNPIEYVNSLGVRYRESMPVAVGHLFNHQTHHRGQVHAMLAQAGVTPPPLDLHRILNP